jgi:hypothetical protein
MKVPAKARIFEEDKPRPGAFTCDFTCDLPCEDDGELRPDGQSKLQNVIRKTLIRLADLAEV